MAKQLNLSSIPALREQPRILPTTPAAAGDVAAVASDVSDLDTRVSDNETDIATLQAFVALWANFADYADDTAAASGGVAVGEFYHTSGAVKVRVS